MNTKITTKTTTKFPKFYICKYGAFYEGQELERYYWSAGDNYNYAYNVILDKFIVHYSNYIPRLYFRAIEGRKSFTYPVEQLGTAFRKKRK